MKIGTLTFHRASNFGGALQCYALVTYLKKRGYDAEVVDYHSKAIEESYTLISTKGLRNFLSSLRKFSYFYKLNKNFRKFRKLIPISKESYHSVNDLQDKYDVLLIGSDQVWSKRINKGFDPVFWGNVKGNTRVVSYAASMGTDHNYTSEEHELIKQYLSNFYAISVREDSLATELSKLTDTQIETVVDPTLLISLEDYYEIADASDLPFEKYVLFYQMEYDPQSTDRVEEFAEQLNCNIVIVGGPKRKFKLPSKHYRYSEIDVAKFLGLYKNATCVFSSSFHGTALSVAFQKDFYFFNIKAIDRAKNLLSHIGALDRMISPSEFVEFSSVDYKTILPKLESFKKRSISFINSVLSNE